MSDFHTHSFFSDGVLLPSELIRRAVVAGYGVIAVTDHAGPGNLEEVLGQLARECEVARNHWPIVALPGVELTHVPPGSIAELARRARSAGAAVVVVHGETIAEPVEPGTNSAAIDAEDVDILAHPGLITSEEAERAAQRGCFIECHEPGDLLSSRFQRLVLLGAGIPEREHATILTENPRELLARVLPRLKGASGGD
ncbi:MAG: histidinol phosphate phosphatase domain-containing protein [Chloroflexi bacterium]|nr:histidinol phosphate phosphatase domain-containing protein [Chloroflexota bacterium]